jgi:hypothetical protein
MLGDSFQAFFDTGGAHVNVIRTFNTSDCRDGFPAEAA